VLKKIVLGVLVFFVLIQFAPYGRDHSNPPVSAEPTWNSADTRDLFVRACANCHSNETVWPWYSHIAPVSWLVQRDVHEARANFNVSRWGSGDNEGDDAAKMLRKNRMPPRVYLLAHAEARLSDAEKQRFIVGLEATFPEGGGEGESMGEKSGYYD
jgi:hypothetical protein